MLSSTVYRIIQPRHSFFPSFLRKSSSFSSLVFNQLQPSRFTLFTLNFVSPLFATLTKTPGGCPPTPSRHLNLYLNFQGFPDQTCGRPLLRRQTVNGKRPTSSPATRRSPLNTFTGAFHG